MKNFLAKAAALIATFFLLFCTLPQTAHAIDTGPLLIELRSSGVGGVGVADDCASGFLINGISAKPTEFLQNQVLTKVNGNCQKVDKSGRNLEANNYTTQTRGLLDGSGSLSANCQAGQVASGITVYNTIGTKYVSGLRLTCKTLADNSISFSNVIGISTSASEDLNCPENSNVFGLWVQAGAILDAIGVRCAKFANLEQSDMKVVLSSYEKVYP